MEIIDSTEMSRICFVSDLHMFADRSNAAAHIPAIRKAAEECELCVLGGDIFDFRWSTLPSREATAQAAIEWLEEIVEGCPSTEFRLLLGNHDHAEPLLERLPGLFDKHDRFHWHCYYLRVGDAIFLHGDAADVPHRSIRRNNGCQATRLAQRRDRSVHHGRRRKHAASHRVYQTFIKTRLHRLVPRVAYPTKRVARRLAAYLDGLNHGAADGVRDVFFGHTHLPVRDYIHAGLRFHNCGAPIGDERFEILFTEVDESAEIVGH